MTPVSKFDEAVPLDSGTASGVLGVKEEFDEPLAEQPAPSLPPPVLPCSPRQQGSIAAVTVWAYFSVGLASGVLVNVSSGIRFYDGVLTLQKYKGHSFLDRALGIFACAAIGTVPPLVFVSSPGAGKALSGHWYGFSPVP